MTIGLLIILIVFLCSIALFVLGHIDSSEGYQIMSCVLFIAAIAGVAMRSEAIQKERLTALCVKEGKNYTVIFEKKVCVL